MKIKVNLQETLFLTGNSVIGATLEHGNKLFVKEGWQTEIFNEFPELIGYDYTIVGHFGLEAWNFQKDTCMPLSDF